jgi:transcriptional regulator with XRE-family HTH domain
MKQPELGKKLSELRKTRGLTQEELVERCNVSVRTIQRIETGEVMPRSYTVRTILSALEYNIDEVFIEESADTDPLPVEKSSQRWLKQMLLMDVDLSNNAFIGRHLFIALIFGLLYFLLTFPEAIAEYARFSEGAIILGHGWYIALKIALVFSFAIFQLGFILVGKIFDNYLLRIATIIHIAILTGLCIYDIVSLNTTDDGRFMLVAASILYGAIGILYGGALLKLREKLGRTVLLAGALEILSGCMFFTVVLFPFADLVNMFAELLELIVLFKVIDLAKKSKIKNVLT